MNHRYELYGLLIESDRSLYANEHAARCDESPLRSPDVVVHHAASEIASRGPRGDEMLLHFQHPEFSYFCERAADGSYTLVFTDACEFEISADLSHVVVHRHQGAVQGIEDVLASGAQMAWQLYMRGSLVLHASAVQTPQGAIAFVAGSGMGKSTMATLMCAANGRIITDDLLRVDFDAGRPVARLGSSELRLRKGADTLADSFQGAAPKRRSSADAREVLRPQDIADDRVPLRALFVPVPERTEPDVRIDRIRATDAVFALMRFPRLNGWIDPTVRTRQFAMLTRLVQAVSLNLAHVPWGPPFSAEIPGKILGEINREREGLRLDLETRVSTR